MRVLTKHVSEMKSCIQNLCTEPQTKNSVYPTTCSSWVCTQTNLALSWSSIINSLFIYDDEDLVETLPSWTLYALHFTHFSVNTDTIIILNGIGNDPFIFFRNLNIKVSINHSLLHCGSGLGISITRGCWWTSQPCKEMIQVLPLSSSEAFRCRAMVSIFYLPWASGSLRCDGDDH